MKKTPRAAARRPAASIVDEPSRRVDAAQHMFDEGQREKALLMFQAAIRAEPRNLRTYILAGRAYGSVFDFERMEDIHRRLLRRAPDLAAARQAVGLTYELIGQPDRATACYEAATAMPDVHPFTWERLAALYEQVHRLDEADEMIQRAVAAGNDGPSLALVRARIRRRLKQPDEAEAMLRDLIDRVPDTDETASMAWGEIALLRDRAGDYAGAMDAIGRCKRVQLREQEPYWSRAQFLAPRTKALMESLTPEHFERWRDDTDALAPMSVALLTGFPRAGTTLLEQVLDAHPALVSSEERGFIGHELRQRLLGMPDASALLAALESVTPERLRGVRAQYFPAMEYLLGEPIAGRMHLDKNPQSNQSIPFIFRAFPEIRLVVALRDPRDVVLSCFLRHLPLNGVSVWFLDLERTATRYAADMNAWLRLRDIIPSPWCEVRYEDSVADLEREARRALEMLGLDWTNDVLSYRDRLHGEKRVISPTYEAVAQPVYTRAVGRWRNYEAYLAPCLDVLEPFVREFGYDA